MTYGICQFCNYAQLFEYKSFSSLQKLKSRLVIKISLRKVNKYQESFVSESCNYSLSTNKHLIPLTSLISIKYLQRFATFSDDSKLSND